MVAKEIQQIFSKVKEVEYSYTDISYSSFSKEYKSALIFAVPHEEQLDLDSYTEEGLEKCTLDARRKIEEILKEIEAFLKGKLEIIYGGGKMKFGERLYELRKNKNISQEELAELLDVSRQSISKWENDKAYPEMTRLLFMSEYFGVSLDYLMRGTECNEINQDTTISYKAKSLLMVWNSFVSNLSGTQRKLVMVLYVLFICVCVAIIVSFIYGVGYVIGQTIAHIVN